MIKKCKISPVRLMVTFWAILHTLRGPITITSWITRLAENQNLLGNASITYISTPRRSLDIYFFSQAHLLKQKGNRIFVTYKGFVNEYELPNRPLGLYTVETFLLDLQRPTRGVGRSPSARITRNTVSRYTGEDGAPPTPAFTHYQDLTNQDYLNQDTGHGKIKLPMIRPRQKKIRGKVIFLIMFHRNTKIRRTSREDACLFLRGESMMQHLHHHRTHTMPLMATPGTSRSNTRLMLSLGRTTSQISRTLIPVSLIFRRGNKVS
jgi:hypothetical protein